MVPRLPSAGPDLYSAGAERPIQPGVISIRAARRYRWRLAGGRLVADGERLRFVPNRLERWRPDTYWECRADHVTGIRVRNRWWLVVDTATGRGERFRVFGAAEAAPKLMQALRAATTPATP